MALKLEAETVLVKDDKSILDNHTSLIQQTADQILQKVSATDFNILTGRVTTAEGSIVINAGNIIQKVSKNDIVNQINLSTEGLTIDVNKLNINGIVTANNGFKINLDGSMEATAGLIAEFTIGPISSISNAMGIRNGYLPDGGMNSNATGMSNNTDWAFWAGNGRFRVQQDGYLFAMNANIEGTINSNSGSIGGWNINNGSLSSGNMTLNSALGRLYVGSGAYLFNYGGSDVMGLRGSINVQGMIYAPSLTLNGHVISIDPDNGYLKAL